MAQDYPKMIYKYMDKSSYKIVHSFEEEEASVKEGYGESNIMLRGEKPEGIEEFKEPTKEEIRKEELKKAEKPKRKRRTSAQVAAEKKPEVVEPKEEPKEEEPKGE